MKIKRANGKRLARWTKQYRPRSVVENPEPAAGNKRSHVAAAETNVSIGVKQRVGHQTRRVVVGIGGVRREVFGKNGMIRRKRKCDDFIESHPGARHGAVETAD